MIIDEEDDMCLYLKFFDVYSTLSASKGILMGSSR